MGAGLARFANFSLAVALATGFGAGCFRAPKAPRNLASPDPTVKIPAIKAKAAAGDRSRVAQLVDDLDDDDPAVRFYAFRALSSLTGETFDYRYYDDELERRPAVLRWRAWLAGQGTPATTRPGGLSE